MIKTFKAYNSFNTVCKNTIEIFKIKLQNTQWNFNVNENYANNVGRLQNITHFLDANCNSVNEGAVLLLPF